MVHLHDDCAVRFVEDPGSIRVGGAICALQFVWRESREAVAPRHCRGSRLILFATDTPLTTLKVHYFRLAHRFTSRRLTRQHINALQRAEAPKTMRRHTQQSAKLYHNSNAIRRLPCLIKEARTQQPESVLSAVLVSTRPIGDANSCSGSDFQKVTSEKGKTQTGAVAGASFLGPRAASSSPLQCKKLVAGMNDTFPRAASRPQALCTARLRDALGSRQPCLTCDLPVCCLTGRIPENADARLLRQCPVRIVRDVDTASRSGSEAASLGVTSGGSSSGTARITDLCPGRVAL